MESLAISLGGDKIHSTLSPMTLHVMSLARLAKHKIAPLAHIRFLKIHREKSQRQHHANPHH
jgi:hypothetical protein